MANEFREHLLGASAVPSDTGTGETKVYLNTSDGPLIGTLGGPDSYFAGCITQIVGTPTQHHIVDVPYDPEGVME